MRLLTLVAALGLLAAGPAAAQTPVQAIAPSAGPGNTFVPVPPVGPPPVARLAWTPIQPAGNVLATLQASGRFTHLIHAINRGGMKKAVSAANVTLLAPSDQAFGALPPERFQALMKDRKALKRLIGHHLIPARIDAAAARTATTPLATVEGSGVAFDLYGERLGVGDAVVMQADLAASNGLIHVIDKVLEPPAPMS